MHPKVLGMHMTAGQRPMTRLASTSWLIKQDANVAHSRRFAPSSSRSKKIQKRKGGKGKGHTVAVEGKGKAKVAIKGKCFYCNVDGHSKRNCPKYLAKKKKKEAKLENNLYVLRPNEAKAVLNHEMFRTTNTQNKRQRISPNNNTYLWHLRLGHINLDRIERLVKNGLLNELENDSLPPCESCLEGKMTKRPFTGKGYRAKEPLELIHSDLCGSMNVKAREDFEYFISFIDDYLRYGYLYLMEHKSKALEKFKDYKAEVENLLSKKIKILRSDRGGEYMDLRFQDYMLKHEIQSQLSAPSTAQQNGGYAVETAVYILNNVPSKSVSETHFELWRERKPSLSHFRIWGCPAHVLVTNPKKLEPRSRLCQFVGYPKETRGGLFFDPQENRVFVSTNATFLKEDHMRDHKPRSKLVLNEATDGSTRVVDEVGLSSRVDQTTTSDLPEGVKPIGCKWIYKRKRDSAGKVHTFKARLVAKGYTQREWVDYEETFSPVAMLKSIRILLSIAIFYDYEIWQMDVKTTFLNGNLEESIFMSQPEGFITQGQEQKVCKLNLSIYALKQASRSLNIRFDTTIKSYGFDQNVDEPCVYKKINKVGIVSRYQSNPRLDHWTAVKIILKKFTSELAFTLNRRAVVWRSIKQGCIADFTMEAEYVAACEAAKEAVWLRKFLHDLEVVPNMNLPITLYCDNSGVVTNSKEPRSHKRGKHIERKYYLIREIVQRGDVIVTKIASKHNIADPFTKTLTAKVFEGHLESLGLRDMYIR
ncbi:gag/pol protein [Cucumis melo var. makuwa]|uniref:Gag/pol protein n=1 Tax=Cucumis melo var. makuwa TaxID=1194695 RepID=A0A5A7T820_CUCMM|nr:gag/pol protein [Cucumis melo var. makuwa]TYK01984.1 gag/pol protein [Cucumis melo var. makuwa]